MMNKIGLVVLFLAALSATDAFKILKQCTYELLEGGEEVENCGKEIVVRVNGTVDQTILFDNDTLEIYQYPNSSNCYVVNQAEFQEGFSGELDKDQCEQESDEDLSAEVKALQPDECTGKVLSLRDCPENHDADARHKRGCISCYLCKYYYRIYIYCGRKIYRRYTICYPQTRCYEQ